MRQTTPHYDSPLKDLPVGSNFEYLFHGFVLMGLDPDFPFAWPPGAPAEIQSTPDVEARQMLTRINTRLRINEHAMRERAVRDLREAGVPEIALSNGRMAAPVSKLVDTLIEAERHRAFASYGGVHEILAVVRADYGARTLDNPSYCRRVTVRVITAAKFRDGVKSPGDLCSFLNDGAAGVRRINRHHLRSVERTFRDELEEMGEARLHQVAEDIGIVDALMSFRDQARKSARYLHLRSLKGAKLAEALHAIRDIRQAVFTFGARHKSRPNAV